MSTASTTQSQCTACARYQNIDTAYSLFKFTLPTINGTVTAAVLHVNVSAIYTSPAVVAHCDQSATNWSEASSSATILGVVAEINGKTATATDEFTGTGWKTINILGTTGSSGTGIARAYELSSSPNPVTVFLNYDGRTDFSSGAGSAEGATLYHGYIPTKGTKDSVEIYSRSNENYPHIDITYTEAATGSATRSILVSPILNSSIVR